MSRLLADLSQSNDFVRRHIGPSGEDVGEMLRTLGIGSLEEMLDLAVPASIRMSEPIHLDPPMREFEMLAKLKTIANKNHVYTSLLGMGYYGTHTPPVIHRKVLENPGWYTAYTPYQAEISQGRLQALLNFQTMVIDLTGMEIANASLLDEATAAAEAMTMLKRITKSESSVFFVDIDCHPQTIQVVTTRAEPLGSRSSSVIRRVISSGSIPTVCCFSTPDRWVQCPTIGPS